ncbi:MAG: hypothetical protein HRT69_17775, partial [Flavobacteriaceae bacterium]|nr:hypothetical protein [Flavobacteriaceae bacterium]
SNGPYNNQIETVKYIINEIDVINNQITELINNNLELNDKFKNQSMSDFHLACINPWLKNEISYELSFDSNLNDGYVGAIFKNGRITEINI